MKTYVKMCRMGHLWDQALCGGYTIDLDVIKISNCVCC